MDIINSILLKVIKGGNIIRVNDQKNTIIGILNDIKPIAYGRIEISTLNTNFIGDMFSNKTMVKKILPISNCSISLISKDEYTFLKSLVIKKMTSEPNKDIKQAYKKMMYKIDENINNSENVTGSLLKMGYRMYPKQKIEIFNKITNASNYVNKEVPKNFDITCLILKHHKILSKRFKNKTP